ncbi:MAG: deoxyguanosinetriphosphate triphosphohydrolase [Firmicutes bacterium]|nr:deoxyguanosinetriphosphate triphosphohydrolase [Bacillota bacterium]
MNLRQTIFELEKNHLSKYASFSDATLGRENKSNPCPIRTEYARDRDRIIHSKSFRRLKHKTQVFLSPEGDHYRTRLTHTLEVSQIARSISRALRLNEDLTEAIALGHDLGHTPYGHTGEEVLSEFIKFNHNEQSLRIVEILENSGQGMNLTKEVKDGILNHRLGLKPMTLEGKVVSWSDKIAYISHDIDDIIRAGFLKESDIPTEFVKVLGKGHTKRINSMILDIITNSLDKPFVSLSESMQKTMLGLREYLFKEFYFSSKVKTEEGKAKDMIRFLFEYYIKNLNLLPQYILELDTSNEQKVCDYISTFTDRYCVRMFKEITVPKNWQL